MNISSRDIVNLLQLRINITESAKERHLLRYKAYTYKSRPIRLFAIYSSATFIEPVEKYLVLEIDRLFKYFYFINDIVDDARNNS